MKNIHVKPATMALCLWAWLASGLLFAQQRSADTFTLADFEPSARLIGVATNPDTGELLYTETWDDDPTAEQAWVRYWGTDGKALAIKRLDFSRSATAPEVFQADFRNRRGFDLKRDGNALQVQKLKLAATQPLDAPTVASSRRVAMADNAVVDAGFDRYVVANWERLAINKASSQFEFLQIDKARMLSLKIKPAKCTDNFSVAVQCFSLNINNRLLSRFISPIKLAYDAESRQLLRYQGLGQLAGADGKGLVVQIDYRYRN